MTTRYVALLRAINLGKARRVPMARLREVLATHGFGAVRTHLATGNVLLDSAMAEPELAARLTTVIAEEFGLDVPVVVRTAEELADVVAADPLGDVVTDPSRYSVSFFPEALDPDLVGALPPGGGPALAVRGRELYLWLPDGMQHAPAGWQTGPLAAGTNRNWNTVRKLVELTR